MSATPTSEVIVAVAARRSLIWILYTILPFVTFFNLARPDFDVDNGVGLVLAYAAVLIAAGLAWFIASRIEGLPRPSVLLVRNQRSPSGAITASRNRPNSPT